MTKLDKSVSFYDIFKSQKQPQILHQDELIMPFFTMNMVRDNFWQFKCWPDVVLWTMTCIIVSPVLTGNVPYISESCIEIKIKLNFYFHTSLWCHRRFYEGLFTLSGIGSLRVNFKNERNCVIIKLPCLIKAKARTGNRDYINCEKYISRMQLFRVVP